MITYPLTDTHQNADLVRQFFDQWGIYRKIVDKNYLFHREAYAAIEAVLTGFPHPISFLDLGAGDADSTARALAHCPLKSYHAVDLSEIALSLAKKNTDPLACEKRFTHADFFQYVKDLHETCDVVFIGLSLHHLPLPDKKRFLPELRRLVAPGGCLMFYEPISEPGESRDEVLARWWKVVSAKWTELTETELSAAKDHVFGNDYPETIDAYEEMAKAAGFGELAVPFVSGDRLYAVFEFKAP